MRKLLLSVMLATTIGSNVSLAFADLITFDFTGRMTVVSPDGTVIPNGSATNLLDPRGEQTPISASLTFDTYLGIGSSNIRIGQVEFLGNIGSIHDINFTRQGNSSLLDGTILVDWAGLFNYPAHIQWDATGLANAINFGLQVGDKISGTTLYRDFNHDGQYNSSEIIVSDLGSAVPYTDNLPYYDDYYDTIAYWHPFTLQGYAPMAATSGTTGFTDGAFPGMRVYLDIGSGNSMYVTSVQTVPLPTAVWLFSSGLLGLIGLMRKKT